MRSDGRNLLDLVDDAPLNGPYWRAVTVIGLATIFDYFDFFLVGFLVAVIGPEWGLTYIEVSVLLLSAGVGSIIGAIIWGMLSDLFGRKIMLIWSFILSGVASGLVAFVPDGNIWLFAGLRFLVGVGVAGATTGGVTMVVELTPLRVRTVLTSAMIIPVSVGILAAALLSSALLPVVGWRGLALAGFAPLLVVLPAIYWLPESPRWLMARSRAADAKQHAARMLGVPAADLPEPPHIIPSKGVPLTELYAMPRRFWFIVLLWFGFSAASYGVILWGPTILSLVLDVSAGEAASLFVAVSLSGLAGRLLFTMLPHWIGRRRSGQIIGLGIAITLGAAAILHQQSYAGVPLLLACLVAGALFFDGGAANLGPISAEVYPARLAARGTGLAQAANGIGKIVGPLILAVITGTDNFVTPKATLDAAGPAFFFLAGCGLIIWFAFTFLGIETHRRSVRLDDGSALAGTSAD